MPTSPTAELLQDGLVLHRRGAFAEAAARYTAVLRADPANADAYHYLAMIACQHGRFAEGAELAQKSLAIDVRQARVHFLLGRALNALGRPAEALASLDQATRLAPDLAQAHGVRANVLGDLGRPADAIAAYDRALALMPDSVEDWFNRGLLLAATGRPAEAVASFDRAVALRPGFAEAHLRRAVALAGLKRHGEALDSLDRVLTIAPKDVEALILRGSALCELRRPQQALASFEHALAIAPARADALAGRGYALNALERHAEALETTRLALASEPDNFNALVNHGVALCELGRFGEALAALDRALALRPDDVGALYNHAFALSELKRDSEALEAYDRLLATVPDHVDALINRGLLLSARDRFADALACYEKVLEIEPDNAKAHFNIGLIRLQSGDLQGGWPEHEWRLKLATFDPPWRDLKARPWLGDWPIEGRTILLVGEQGFGDTLQMVRYAPLVAHLGANVILGVQAPLVELLSRTAGVDTVVALNGPPPQCDGYCRLMSLPFAFKTAASSIPTDVPYVTAPPARVALWRERLSPRRRPRVGVVWCGNPEFKGDATRSMTLAQFAPALSVAGIGYISLNPGIAERDVAALAAMPDVFHAASQFRDFADTAAVLDCLDLVVTSDTALAHLAGAMGKKLWVMLSWGCDWRWMRERQDCSWYPTARLFRPPAPGDWAAVVENVRRELTLFAKAAAD